MSAADSLAALPAPAAEPATRKVRELRIVVDTSEKRPVYLLTGRNRACIRLSASAAYLLRQIEQGVSFEQIAERMSTRSGRPLSAVDIEAAHGKIIERIAAIEGRTTESKGLFWMRRRILPMTLVEPVAKRLSIAFHPVIAGGLVLLIASGAALALRIGLRSDPAHFWYAYVLFLISLAAHELGHASACARYGATPGDIGFVMYFLYPSFFSDSNAAWALKRWQRVVVDLGGVYFQLVVGALYCGLFWLSGWEPLRAAVLLNAGSCLVSLNPILKFDGYWMLSDAMGVTNLGRQPQRIVEHVLDRIRGRAPRPLPWSAPVTWIVVVYTIGTLCFWGGFFWRIAPVLGGHLVTTVYALVDFIARLRAEPAWPDGKMVRDTLTSLYVSLFLVVLLSRGARAVLDAIRRRLAKVNEARTP